MMPSTTQTDRNDPVRRLQTPQPEQHADIVFEEYLLRRAALARAESERQMADAVSVALSAGISWTRIGRLLGTSAQAAQDRYRAAERRAS